MTSQVKSAAAPPPASITARVLEADRYMTDAATTVYRYNGAFWEPVPKIELEQIALNADQRSTRARRAEIVGLIQAHTYRKNLTWGRVADHQFACASGVVDVRTGVLRPHSPEDLLDKVIPHQYAPGAPCRTWSRALEDWFAEDTGGEIAALQEFFGYVILEHAKFKKCLVLYGSGDVGKSVVLKVLRLLVGSAHCCSLPPEKMGDEQARTVLIGKRLNIMGEALRLR